MKYLRRLKRLCLLCVFGLTGEVLVSDAPAQRLEVIRDSVVPHWNEEGTQFWYLSKVEPDRQETWLIIAATGQRERVQDDSLLADPPRQTNPANPSRRREGSRGNSNRTWRSSSPSRTHTLEVRDHNLCLITERRRDEAVPLTTDGTEDNSFRRSAQSARLVGMQYNTQDFPERQADIIWSPNSRFVVAWQTKVVPERRVQLKPSQPEKYSENDLSYPYAKPGDELPSKSLRLFDVEQNREIPITGATFDDPWSLTLDRLSPDGNVAWVYYNQRGHQLIQVVRIDLETGQAKVVIEETSPTFLHYSAGVKYRLWWQDEETAVWSSERTGWNHLYRINMNTGEVLNAVTKGEWNVKNVSEIRDGVVWFSAVGIAADQDPYHEHFCRVDLDGSNFVQLTQGDGMHTISWSPNRDYFIDQYSRVDLPPVHELRSADGELICELERAELVSASAESEYRLPRRFVAPGRDGQTPIYGIVHFPSDFDSQKSYPVLESIYAGPHDYHVPKRFRPARSFARFTAAGFVVVQIDGMGTAWRSKAFHDVCYRNLRDAGFPDRIAWIKALAKEYPNLDLNRVGIFGGSAGGQNAMAALLWHHDFYKVAVADCGCHDNRMDKIWWNEQWLGRVEPGSHYVENSNLENAHLLQGKLLLVVGEMDKNVDPASTLDVAAKLDELGKQEHFELLAIPGAGHGSAESPIGQERRLEFFKQHLIEAN
jgi:dipeptidyl aminopeptidase/acylaminoacyl peptidase